MGGRKDLASMRQQLSMIEEDDADDILDGRRLSHFSIDPNKDIVDEEVEEEINDNLGFDNYGHHAGYDNSYVDTTYLQFSSSLTKDMPVVFEERADTEGTPKEILYQSQQFERNGNVMGDGRTTVHDGTKRFEDLENGNIIVNELPNVCHHHTMYSENTDRAQLGQNDTQSSYTNECEHLLTQETNVKDKTTESLQEMFQVLITSIEGGVFDNEPRRYKELKADDLVQDSSLLILTQDMVECQPKAVDNIISTFKEKFSLPNAKHQPVRQKSRRTLELEKLAAKNSEEAVKSESIVCHQEDLSLTSTEVAAVPCYQDPLCVAESGSHHMTQSDINVISNDLNEVEKPESPRFTYTQQQNEYVLTKATDSALEQDTILHSSHDTECDNVAFSCSPYYSERPKVETTEEEGLEVSQIPSNHNDDSTSIEICNSGSENFSNVEHPIEQISGETSCRTVCLPNETFDEVPLTNEMASEVHGAVSLTTTSRDPPDIYNTETSESECKAQNTKCNHTYTAMFSSEDSDECILGSFLPVVYINEDETDMNTENCSATKENDTDIRAETQEEVPTDKENQAYVSIQIENQELNPIKMDNQNNVSIAAENQELVLTETVNHEKVPVTVRNQVEVLVSLRYHEWVPVTLRYPEEVPVTPVNQEEVPVSLRNQEDVPVSLRNQEEVPVTVRNQTEIPVSIIKPQQIIEICVTDETNEVKEDCLNDITNRDCSNTNNKSAADRKKAVHFAENLPTKNTMSLSSSSTPTSSLSASPQSSSSSTSSFLTVPSSGPKLASHPNLGLTANKPPMLRGVSQPNMRRSHADKLPSQDNNSNSPNQTKEPKYKTKDLNSDLAKLKDTAVRLRLTTRRPSYLEWLENYTVRRRKLPVCGQSPAEIINQGNASKDRQRTYRGKDRDRLTPERKQRIDKSLDWLRTELQLMRNQDQALAKQLLALYHDIHKTRLSWSCQEHRELLDEVQYDLEELYEFSNVLDLPRTCLLNTPLKHVGVTRLNISERRFSTC